MQRGLNNDYVDVFSSFLNTKKVSLEVNLAQVLCIHNHYKHNHNANTDKQ